MRVRGRPTQETLDLDRQIADREWAKRALPEWFVWKNVREMHQPSAVGTGESLEFDENDDPWITARVVDPIAAMKVREGVYKGFSIGIKNPVVQRDPEAPGGRIVGGDIVEVSLVDRPAVPTARFDLAKAAGAGRWLDCQAGVVWEKEAVQRGFQNAVLGLDPEGNPIAQPGHPQGGDFQILTEDANSITVQMGGRRYRVPVGTDSQGNIVAGTPEEIPPDVWPEATGKGATTVGSRTMEQAGASFEKLKRGAQGSMQLRHAADDHHHDVVETYPDRVIVSCGWDGPLWAVPVEYLEDGDGDGDDDDVRYGEPYRVETLYTARDEATKAALKGAFALLGKAAWSTAYIDELPDEAFAYVAPGGKKEDGKTTPRDLRHLPYKDKDLKLDAPHVRNALARLDQTDIPAEAKAEARRKLEAAAKELGIEVHEGKDGDEGEEAAKKAAFAVAEGQRKLCRECDASVRLKKAASAKALPGGYQVIGRGDCGHAVVAFVTQAQVARKMSEAEGPQEPDGAEAAHAEHQRTGTRDDKCPLCKKGESPAKPRGDEDAHVAADDAFAQKVAGLLLQRLLKDAGPTDTARAERTREHVLRDIKGSHARLGALLEELENGYADEGVKPDARKGTDPDGGPARVSGVDPKERIAPLRAELRRMEALLDEAEGDLNQDRSPAARGVMGTADDLPPARKPRGDGTLDFTSGDGKAVVAALLKRAAEPEAGAIAAEIGKRVREVLEPVARRLERVEHMAEPVRVDLTPADRRHALDPVESSARKAAAVEAVREQLQRLGPKERDRVIGAAIAAQRGWGS